MILMLDVLIYNAEVLLVYAIFLQIIFLAFLTIAYYKCWNRLPLYTVSLKI